MDTFQQYNYPNSTLVAFNATYNKGWRTTPAKGRALRQFPRLRHYHSANAQNNWHCCGAARSRYRSRTRSGPRVPSPSSVGLGWSSSSAAAAASLERILRERRRNRVIRNGCPIQRKEKAMDEPKYEKWPFLLSAVPIMSHHKVVPDGELV